MNKDFLLAQVIKACCLGIKHAERDDLSPTLYVEILESLALELEHPQVTTEQIKIHTIGEEFPKYLTVEEMFAPGEHHWTREELEWKSNVTV